MRIGTFSNFRRVLSGLRNNQFDVARAQEQLASGRRILRPSDDPTGAARAVRFERQIADVERFRGAITSGRNTANTGAASLTQASGIIGEARELLLQGLNGTLTQEDRESIAAEFELIRSQLLELANTRSGDLYIFGGTQTGSSPFVEVTRGGRTSIEYRGNQEEQLIRAGERTDVSITLAGSDAFGRFEPSGTIISGLTGVQSGLTADQGSGFLDLELRNDSTTLPPDLFSATGLASFGGGSADTILGDNTLSIDAAAGTIQLGTGPAVPLPSTPYPNDFVLQNELGGELRLDFTGYTGPADYTGTVTGNGSYSLDGTQFTPLSFSETDLELIDDETGAVIHLDTTSVRRAGSDLVEFGGTSNIFDLIQQIASDLTNAEGVDPATMNERLSARLEDLDRQHENVLVGVGVLGSRTRRLDISDQRAQDIQTSLQGLLSNVADADLAEVAVDLSRSQFLLQLAQTAGSRLLQTSLLNFLQ